MSWSGFGLDSGAAGTETQATFTLRRSALDAPCAASPCRGVGATRRATTQSATHEAIGVNEALKRRALSLCAGHLSGSSKTVEAASIG